jgi:hypothetical protein
MMSGGCATLSDGPLLNNNLGFTIEFWMKTSSPFSGVLFDKRGSEVAGDNDWYISYVSSPITSQLRFHYGLNNNQDGVFTMNFNKINDNEWHHVALTSNSNGKHRWWVDGSNQGVQTSTNLLDLANPVTALSIGCGYYGEKAYSGQLDEIRISNYERYAGAFVPPNRHLRDNSTVALWHLDGTELSETLADSMGNWDAVVKGMLNYSPDTTKGLGSCCGDGDIVYGEECDVLLGDPTGACTGACTLAGGVPNFSGSFDGKTACFKSTGSPFLTNEDDFTVEFWIKTDSNATMTVLDKTTPGAGFSGGWRVRLVKGFAQFEAIQFQPPGFAISNGSMHIADGEWHHLAHIRSGNSFVWYVDGNKTSQYLIYFVNPLGLATGLYVGCYAGSASYFSGELDEIKISSTIAYTINFEPEKTSGATDKTQLLYSFDTPPIVDMLLDFSKFSRHTLGLGNGFELSEDTP